MEDEARSTRGGDREIHIKLLVENPGGTIPLRRLLRRSDETIKVDLKQRGCDGVD
jgi:hypothetical protein